MATVRLLVINKPNSTNANSVDANKIHQQTECLLHGGKEIKQAINQFLAQITDKHNSLFSPSVVILPSSERVMSLFRLIHMSYVFN